MKQAIIIIGGYNSAWPAYLGMARHLEDLSGLQAVAVPLLPWDWWSAERRQDGRNLLTKLSETVDWARRRFEAQSFALVGHSAGGILARLYLSPEPVWDQPCDGSDHVSRVISLGSPHCASQGTKTGWFLTDQANAAMPALLCPGHVQCHPVSSRYLLGSETGTYPEKRAHRRYRFFAGRGDLWGDGIIPVDCAGMPGNDTQVLDGIAHSRKVGRNWYGGSKAIVRLWWPTEEAHGD